MAQLSSIDKYNWNMSGYSGVRETTQGNIVINGAYYSVSTLAPIGTLETAGVYTALYPNAGVATPIATYARGIVSAPPLNMINGVQNWNLLLGQCHYYASGFGQLKQTLNDTANGYTYQMTPRLAGEDVGFGFSSGPTGGFGLIKCIGARNLTGSVYYAGMQQTISRNSTDALISSQVYADQATAGVPAAGSIISGYSPGYIKLDSAGIRYLWKLPYYATTTSGTYQGTSYGYLTGGATGFGSAAACGTAYALLGDGTTPTTWTNSTLNFANGATLVSNGSMFGKGTAYAWATTTSPAYRHFIYATANLIYFVEFQYNTMYAAGGATNAAWLLRKMNFGGTETTILSLSSTNSFGYTLPTSVFGITATTANVIFPVFGSVTMSTGATSSNLQFRKMQIDIANGAETITTLTPLGAGIDTAANVFYGQTGIFGTTSGSTATNPVGPYSTGDTSFRAASTFRTWVVTGASGQLYLNLSFEHTFYNFGTYPTIGVDTSGRAMSTVPSVAGNTVNPVMGTYKTANAFSILSYTVDSGLTSATYQAKTDMSQYLPRWYMPTVSSGLVQWVSCAWDTLNDIIMKFNETTFIWERVTTLGYRADQVGVDQLGRVWATSSLVGGTQLSPKAGAGLTWGSDQIILEAANLPVSVNVVTNAATYTYSGSVINTSFTMNVTNFYGSLVASNVYVQLSGGLQFGDGTVNQYIITSNTATTTTSINVVNGNSSKINTTIVQVL